MTCSVECTRVPKDIRHYRYRLEKGLTVEKSDLRSLVSKYQVWADRHQGSSKYETWLYLAKQLFSVYRERAWVRLGWVHNTMVDMYSGHKQAPHPEVLERETLRWTDERDKDGQAIGEIARFEDDKYDPASAALTRDIMVANGASQAELKEFDRHQTEARKHPMAGGRESAIKVISNRISERRREILEVKRQYQYFAGLIAGAYSATPPRAIKKHPVTSLVEGLDRVLGIYDKWMERYTGRA